MASNQGNQGGNQGNQGGNQVKQGGKQDDQDDQRGAGGSRQSGDASNRGFASMDPDKQREIAAEGGRAAHASGRAHEFTPEEARAAGAQSHKNDGNRQSDDGEGGAKAGGASGSASGAGSSGGKRGGTPEQHAAAGRQSHKNDGGKQDG